MCCLNVGNAATYDRKIPKTCKQKYEECEHWRNVKVSTAQNLTWYELLRRKNELKFAFMVTQDESVVQLTNTHMPL